MERLTLVLGAGEGVWDEAAAVVRMAQDAGMAHSVVAVNDVGVHAGRVDRWATLHPERLHWWTTQRWLSGLPDAEATVSNRPATPRGYPPHWADYNPDLHPQVVVPHWGGGSSGLYGVAVAAAGGAERVVLCGVPLDDRQAFAGTREVHHVSEHLPAFRRAWIRKADRLRGLVRSMAGWTQHLLGAPTEDWLT